ncbi:hypothetical protein GMORB2_3582 [Geosmithia morbida]|uniref:Uncharacterized protein n=1 Tax=Geosmithia morbida TaxID=1094350 RepID=A0A9P4YRX0_9HYPO|nr:uncharacterized protein GMORB2_3582 [Geosmithia morbida]KAF4119894.1 hypothetical protein GMORB2_3582 [Geosmithia morbida]
MQPSRKGRPSTTSAKSSTSRSRGLGGGTTGAKPRNIHFWPPASKATPIPQTSPAWDSTGPGLQSRGHPSHAPSTSSRGNQNQARPQSSNSASVARTGARQWLADGQNERNLASATEMAPVGHRRGA